MECFVCLFACFFQSFCLLKKQEWLCTLGAEVQVFQWETTEFTFEYLIYTCYKKNWMNKQYPAKLQSGG